MKEHLATAYPRQLRTMFTMVGRHFTEKAFGGKKAIISLTTPFMVLEKWRENGHACEIPLLDEAVKNIVIATASSIFGWEKTCCLHLRVVLENIFYGAFLMSNPTHLSRFNSTGELNFRRFSSLLADFPNISKETRKANRLLKICDCAESLYHSLSKWTHTLGEDFVSDLSILGYSKLSNASTGRLRDYYTQIGKLCTTTYLSIKPNIFTAVSATEQRYFLQPLSISERKLLRDALGI